MQIGRLSFCLTFLQNAPALSLIYDKSNIYLFWKSRLHLYILIKRFYQKCQNCNIITYFVRVANNILNLLGIFHNLKWGARFNLYQYTGNLPYSTLYNVSMSYASSSWSSHQTAWLSFRAFCLHTNTVANLPVSPQNLAFYVDYLAKWRMLEISTIRGYLSSIKILHFLNGYSKFTCDNIFSHYLVKKSLEGLENIRRINPKPVNPRRVMSFECLQLLGHALIKQGFSDWDTQIIWSACLLGYWGSFRMGEIIPSGNQPYQEVSALKWERVLEPSSNKLTISIRFPKTVKQTGAQAVDIYKYMDTNYCPVYQLIKVYNLNLAKGGVQPGNLVFRLESGFMLTMPRLNNVLRNTMSMFFDNRHRFSCHSFRAGIPSMMASQPHLFNEQEIMVNARWNSDAFHAYTRLSGISRDISIKKIHESLQTRYLKYMNNWIIIAPKFLFSTYSSILAFDIFNLDL